MLSMLFAYETLMPGDAAEAESGCWRAEAVRGRLFDLGAYPALVDLNDPAAGWVEGFVRPVGAGELESCLDPWEGVGEGLYRRVETTTRGSCRVWVYVYNRPVPAEARGPLVRWNGPRRAPRFVSAADVQPGETD